MRFYMFFSLVFFSIFLFSSWFFYFHRDFSADFDFLWQFFSWFSFMFWLFDFFFKKVYKEFFEGFTLRTESWKLKNTMASEIFFQQNPELLTSCCSIVLLTKKQDDITTSNLLNFSMFSFFTSSLFSNKLKSFECW